MTNSRIFPCTASWVTLLMLVPLCLGQTSVVTLPEDAPSNENRTNGPEGNSNKTTVLGDPKLVPKTLLQIVGLIPNITQSSSGEVPPSNLNEYNDDHNESIAAGDGDIDDKDFDEDAILREKMAEVLRRLAHPNVTGGNGGMEPSDKGFYGAFTSRSELPRGKCLIAIIWEAARPSATFEELLVLLDDMQDDLEDMQDDLLTLMEDMMYRDVFEEEYYYEDDEFYDYNDNLYDERFPADADPGYYQDDVPYFDNEKEFDEDAREEAHADNDRLLLFAPWMN